MHCGMILYISSNVKNLKNLAHILIEFILHWGTFLVWAPPLDSVFNPPALQVQPHGTSLYCSDLLDDTACVALLVVGFLLMTPLLVLALAAFCRLARHLQLGMCFIPYSRAVYKNLPVSQRRGPGAGGCCGQQEQKERDGKGSVWV